MQVISRGVNEGLIIDGQIVVKVLDVQDDHVRLGITSPNDYPSYWEETIYCEKVEAAQALC